MNGDGGLFGDVSQATIALLTAKSDIFLGIGMSIFHSLAVILLIWEGCRIGFRRSDGGGLVTVLISIAIIDSVLTFYSGFTHTITNAGISLASYIDGSMMKQVSTSMSDSVTDLGGSTWSMLNPLAYGRYWIWIGMITGLEALMIGVLAFGYAAVGILVLIGPLFVPMYLIPQLEWMAVGWFRSLISYSSYPLIGAAFVYIYAQVLQHFFTRHGTIDAQSIGPLIGEMMVLFLGCFFGIRQIPQFISHLFSGGSGGNVMPSLGAWR
jgi:type IV secretory pathway VirB6-like protein